MKHQREFERETARAQRLVFNRPAGWEYLLTAELLRSKLIPIKRKFTDLERGLIYRRTTSLQGEDFINWVGVMCTDLASLIRIASKAITQEIPNSWGLPGVAGDPLEIKHATDILISFCNGLLEWEVEVRSVVPPNPLQPLKQKMEGWTSQLLEEVVSFPDKLEEPFNQPNPTGQYDIHLIFKEPPGLAEARAEIQRLQRHPKELRKIYRNK